jgi:hypothetical protein
MCLSCRRYGYWLDNDLIYLNSGCMRPRVSYWSSQSAWSTMTGRHARPHSQACCARNRSQRECRGVRRRCLSRVSTPLWSMCALLVGASRWPARPRPNVDTRGGTPKDRQTPAGQRGSSSTEGVPDDSDHAPVRARAEVQRRAEAIRRLDQTRRLSEWSNRC